MHTGQFDHVVVEAERFRMTSCSTTCRCAANRGVADLRPREGRAQPESEEDGYRLYRIGDVVGSRDRHCALRRPRICANI